MKDAIGKVYINGIYHGIGAPLFPFVQQFLCVYASATNGHGRTTVNLRIGDYEEGQPPVVDASSEVFFPDPLGVADMVFALMNVVWPHEGDYLIQIFCNGQLAKSQRLRVMAIPKIHPNLGETDDHSTGGSG
jgi:hypothetical protein